MKLHELKPNPGSVKKKEIRKSTATGQENFRQRYDGQGSPSGGGTRPGFEGGNMPLYRRLPRGFTNVLDTVCRIECQV